MFGYYSSLFGNKEIRGIKVEIANIDYIPGFSNTTGPVVVGSAYMFLVETIKNCAINETSYKNLQEMKDYLTKLNELMVAYKSILESPKQEMTATFAGQLAEFVNNSHDNYDTYAEISQWKENAVAFGCILLCATIGLIIGAALFGLTAGVLPFAVCALIGGPLAPWLPAIIGSAATFGAIGGLLGGYAGVQIGGMAMASPYEDDSKPGKSSFIKKQKDLTDKMTESLAPMILT